MLNKFIQTIVMTLFFLGAAAMSNADDTTNINSVTAVLPVERIEPSIPFWEKAGFVQGDSVPEGDHLGFLMMASGDALIMLQTFEGLAGDNEIFANVKKGTETMLFIQVKDVRATEAALNGFNLIMPYRETFYGSKEVSFKSPAGHIVTFAEFPAQE